MHNPLKNSFDLKDWIFRFTWNASLYSQKSFLLYTYQTKMCIMKPNNNGHRRTPYFKEPQRWVLKRKFKAVWSKENLPLISETTLRLDDCQIRRRETGDRHIIVLGKAKTWGKIPCSRMPGKSVPLSKNWGKFKVGHLLTLYIRPVYFLASLPPFIQRDFTF